MRQALERSAQAGHHLALAELLGRMARGPGALVALEAFDRLARAASRTHAKVIARDVQRDAPQPGRQGLTVAQVRQRAPSADKGVLREVLGVLVIAREAEQERVHAAEVRARQFLERGSIAGARSAHQIDFTFARIFQ